MEYTTQQIQDIFSLIEKSSLYAFPLMLALIMPLFWFITKNLLGVTFAPQDDGKVEEETTLLKKVSAFFKKLFKGAQLDKTVFLTSFVLFILGGCILKFGEYHIENKRQKAIALENYMLSNLQTNMKNADIQKGGVIDTTEIEDIIYYFPSEFTRTDKGVMLLDSTITKQYYEKVYPLLEMYLDTQLDSLKKIAIDTTNRGDNKITNMFNPNNAIQNLFLNDMAFSFLGKPESQKKYTILVEENIPYIIKQKK